MPICRHLTRASVWCYMQVLTHLLAPILRCRKIHSPTALAGNAEVDRGCIIEWLAVGLGRHLSELPPPVQLTNAMGCKLRFAIELSLSPPPEMMPDQEGAQAQ